MRGLQERREAAHLMRFMRRVRFFSLGLPDEVHEKGEVGEGGRQQRVRVEELDGQVEPSVPAEISSKLRLGLYWEIGLDWHKIS